MTPLPATNSQSPLSHQPETGFSQAVTGGPGAAEPVECPDAPWVSPAPTRAPQLRSPDDPVLPLRLVPGAWGYAGVSAILDARDRTIAMAETSRAQWFIDRINEAGV